MPIPEITVSSLTQPVITHKAKVEDLDRELSENEVMQEVLNSGRKIRVLWYSDFLRPTGFGNVAEEIISRLQRTGKYEFRILAINHYGVPYNTKDSPYYKFRDIPVYPAMDTPIATTATDKDLLGRQRLANMMADYDFDILFVIQDAFNMLPLSDAIKAFKKAKPASKYVLYFPVDGEVPREWITDVIDVADHPVVYTDFGKALIHSHMPSGLERMAVINHGTDCSVFRPFDTVSDRQKFRRDFFHVKDDETFIVTNVNRNQPRKDLARSIMAFSKFVENGNENSVFYLHCDVQDVFGLDIPKFLSLNVSPDVQKKIMFPPYKSIRTNNGFPKEAMRGIYASSDLLISTSLGEGWGLATTEAMACETPVVVPDNTSNPEIVGLNQERGYLVKSGSNMSEWYTQRFDNEIMRPLTNIEDLVDKMAHVRNNREEAKEKAKKARAWLVENLSWDDLCQKWDDKLTGIYVNECLPNVRIK